MAVTLVVLIAGILIYEAYINGVGLSSIPILGPAIMGATMQSYSDLLTLAQNAGFTGNDAVTAAAVAMAESGGNARAYNPETAAGTPTGKGSYGLWQIYLYAHPEFEGQDLYDPPTNALAAYDTWFKAGGSFSPWSTFNSGKYTEFLPSCCGGAISA